MLKRQTHVHRHTLIFFPQFVLNKTWLMKVCQSLARCRGSRMEAFCSHIRSDKRCARASSVSARHGCYSEQLGCLMLALCVSVSLISLSFYFSLPFSSCSLLCVFFVPPTTINLCLPLRPSTSRTHTQSGLINAPAYRRSILRWKQESRK